MHTQRSAVTTSSRLLVVLFLLVAPALGGSNCQPYEAEGDLDAQSSGDRTREGSVEVSLNTTIVDNVSTVRLDKTDWKYFVVPAPGVIEIVVSFDNSRAYGEMVVTDQVGQIISTFADEKKHLLDRVTFKANAGQFYLQFWVNSEQSDYSVQINYTAL